MKDKNLEALILKVMKKLLKKEINKLEQDQLTLVANDVNKRLENFSETFETEAEKHTTTEILDDMYTSNFVNLHTREDLELDRKLRELKFKQDLRKDWILFILRDVVVYAFTLLFIFSFGGFYLFTLIESSGDL